MTVSLSYEKALPEDTEAILTIIENARRLLRSEGIDQWQDGNPSEAAIKNDIKNGWGRIIRSCGKAVGYFALQTETDPSYGHIWGGKWLSAGEPYAALHHAAVADGARGQGLSSFMFESAENECISRGIKNLRIDTHRLNTRMRHIIKRHGFTLCGIIHLVNSPAQRMAYEKRLP